MELLEEDARLFYKLLNHTHLTELRFLKRGTFPIVRIVREERAFLEIIKKWNGRRNIYAGLRDRRPDLVGAANMFDIIGLQIVVLDIDPIRPREIPATDEERKMALRAALEIKNWFVERGFSKPAIAHTGNGACLYFKVPYYEVTDENRFELTDSLAYFEQTTRHIMRDILKKYNCQMDSMYDLPRIGRVIGTMNVKGEESKERKYSVSRWIEPPLNVEEDAKLLNAILSRNFP